MEHNLKIQTNIQIPKRSQILHEIWSEEPKRFQFFSVYLNFFLKLKFLKKPKNIIENTNPELKKVFAIPKTYLKYPEDLIYTKISYFGYPIGTRIGYGLEQRPAYPEKLICTFP